MELIEDLRPTLREGIERDIVALDSLIDELLSVSRLQASVAGKDRQSVDLLELSSIEADLMEVMPLSL